MTGRAAPYSTHKSIPEALRLRLIVPLAREVREDEYPALERMVAKEIGIDLFDDTTYEPSRLMYWPSTPSDGEFVFREKDGQLLDPDMYLSKYADWRDTSMWPTSKRQSEVLKRRLTQQQDPHAKSGVIGAFCKAYSIEDVIEAFLSSVYEPSAMAGRYDYIPAGLIDLNIKKCFYELNRLNRYINSIKDSQMRMILLLRYINGMTWQQIVFSIGEYDEQYPPASITIF